jgi:hypothetical protein
MGTNDANDIGARIKRLNERLGLPDSVNWRVAEKGAEPKVYNSSGHAVADEELHTFPADALAQSDIPYCSNEFCAKLAPQIDSYCHSLNMPPGTPFLIITDSGECYCCCGGNAECGNIEGKQMSAILIKGD